jgi:hypothetical protein
MGRLRFGQGSGGGEGARMYSMGESLKARTWASANLREIASTLTTLIGIFLNVQVVEGFPHTAFFSVNFPYAFVTLEAS